MRNFLNKFKWFILTGISFLALPLVAFSISVAIPQSPIQGTIPVGLSNGNYLAGQLKAGSNITISTSTLGQITISGSAGGNSAWLFGPGTIYNATSTDFVGIGTTTPTYKLSITPDETLIGGELITNGTFAGNTTGWHFQGGGSLEPNYHDNSITVSIVNALPTERPGTDVNVVNGAYYKVSFTLSGVTPGQAVYSYAEATAEQENEPWVDGIHSYVFRANATGSTFLLWDIWDRGTGMAPGSFTLSNVSMHQIVAPQPLLSVRDINDEPFLNISNSILGNTQYGKSALANVAIGGNSAFGYGALKLDTTGYLNTANGSLALALHTTGNQNAAFGARAAIHNLTGSENLALGPDSLYFNTTGNGNIAIGFGAGAGNSALESTMGSYNILIGRNINTTSTSTNNQLVLANVLFGTDIYGNATGKIGINTSSPTEALTVNGNAEVGGSASLDGYGTDHTRLYVKDVRTLATDYANGIVLNSSPTLTSPHAFYDGVNAFTQINGSQQYDWVAALDGYAVANASTVDEALGVRGAGNVNSGNVALLEGVKGSLGLSGGHATTAAAFYASSPFGSASRATNLYGLYVESQAGATNNYAIYTNTGKVIFNDSVGINTSTPANALSVVGSISSSNLTNGNCVQAGAGGVLTTTSAACATAVAATFTVGNGVIYNATSTDLVGIGTITPTSTLFVQGKGGTNPFVVASSTGTQLLTVTQAGNVGIGTTAPATTLSVQGTTTSVGLAVTGPGPVGLINYSGYGGLTQGVEIADTSGQGVFYAIRRGNGGQSTTALSWANNNQNVAVGNTLYIGGFLTSNTGVNLDTALNRKVANQLEVDNGTIGQWRDFIVRSLSGNTTSTTSVLTVMGTSTAATVPLLTLSSSTGASMFAVTAGGAVNIQGTATSTTAFTIKNPSGQSVMTVDSNPPTSVIFQVASSTPGTFSKIFNVNVDNTVGINTTTLGTANLIVQGSTTTPQTLDLFRVTSSTGASVFKITSAGTVFLPNLTQSAANQTYYACGAATTFEIIWDTTTCLISAAKFKTNIQNMNLSIDDFMKLRPVTYQKKNPLNKTDTGRQPGFVADEVAKISPQIDELFVTRDSKGEIHGFRYEQFTAWLTDIVQKIIARLDRQENRIKQLEQKVEQQQKQIDQLINERK